jgi:hypothetical protein
LAHYRILRHRPALRAGLEFIGRPRADTSALEQSSSAGPSETQLSLEPMNLPDSQD